MYDHGSCQFLGKILERISFLFFFFFPFPTPKKTKTKTKTKTKLSVFAEFRKECFHTKLSGGGDVGEVKESHFVSICLGEWREDEGEEEGRTKIKRRQWRI